MVGYPPGSKRFFETIDVPGVKVGYVVRIRPSSVLVALIADPGTTTPLETLQKQYIDACALSLPIGMGLTVSIKSPSVNS